MVTKPKKPKKVGFWYGAGKVIGNLFSGIENEASAEENRIEDSAKEYILGHLFAKDIKSLIEDFNYPDPEESIDSETGKTVWKRKTLEEHRQYVKKKIKLTELENYLNRYPQLRDIIGPSEILSSTVARYGRSVAAIRQEIHWTQYNIIDKLIKEDTAQYEVTQYIEYWSKQLSKNYLDFKYAVEDFKEREQNFVSLGFDSTIFDNIIATCAECNEQYKRLYSLVREVLNVSFFSNSSLQSIRDSLDDLDDQILFELRKIRRYNYGLDTNKETRDRLSFLIQMRNMVNDLFLSKFKFRLLIQDERSLEQVSRVCPDYGSFVSNIAALGTLIDKIDVTQLKQKLKIKPQDGSVNILEQFLKENFPNYDLKIIKNLRAIVTIRNQWPIHDNTQKGITIIQEIYGTFPVDDYGAFWLKLLNLYSESLVGLKSLMTS